MEEGYHQEDRTVFDLIKGLIKSLRLFQNESVFCENITFVQFCILDYISSAEGQLGMSSLHSLLGVEKSTTTRLAAPLIKQNLLMRVASSKDSRAVELKMTREGEKVHNAVWACMKRFIEDCRQSIPDTDRKDVISSVNMFIHSLENCCRRDRNCC
ncbi:MAG: MarR family transcriptional regulator [Proteobacteria bacterium]|nr:MarR family transcriptional regulator [Pseudomonadota bacterium]